MMSMQAPFDPDLTDEVNAHILQLADEIDRSHEGKHRWSFVCECAAGCQERVLLSRGEYEGLKLWGRPILAAGHTRREPPSP
jgi:hypothetical protein